MLPDVARHMWFAYHEGPLWAVLVYAGRLTEHDVQSSLNSSRRDRGPLQQAGPCPFAPFPRYDERAAPRSHSDMLNSSDRDRAFGRCGFQAFSGVPRQLGCKEEFNQLD